jgi:hypothetical protein
MMFSTVQRRFPAALAAALCAAVAAPALAQSRSYSLIEQPGADYAGFWRINNSGTILTWDQTGNYLRHRDGTMTLYGVPPGLHSHDSDINARGVIVSTLFDQFENATVALRDPAGNWRIIAGPGSGIELGSINDQGVAAGSYSPDQGETWRGVLVETNRGDAITYIDHPTLANTFLYGNNNRGTLLGRAFSEDWSVNEWFVVRNGTFSTLPAPADIASGRRPLYTEVNNKDEIVGAYRDSALQLKSFILSPSGTFEIIEVPNLAAALLPVMPLTYDGLIRVDNAFGTLAYGFNDRGDVVGPTGVGYANPATPNVVVFYLFSNMPFVSSR